MSDCFSLIKFPAPRNCGTPHALGSMPYALFTHERFSAETAAQMRAAFDEVCVELGLKPNDDPLCNIVAQEIIRCVEAGHRDPILLRDCARKALRPN